MTTYKIKIGGKTCGWLTTSDFDTARFPCPPATVEPSANECRHTPTPQGYNEHSEWCKQASKTHSQIQCPHCGLWAIWLPKAVAKQINKLAKVEEREIIKAVKRQMAAELRQRKKQQSASTTRRKGLS